MPNNDREVFDHLTIEAESGTQQRQTAFLSYALFAFEKREWIKLYKSKHEGAEPAQSDIDGWISNITENQFTTWRNEAERFFVEAADAYFQDQMVLERQEILRSAIVSEVKAASATWKQLGIALLTAILAPLIIGGIIVAAAAYDKNMFTSSSITDRLKQEGQTKPVPQAPPPPR